VPLPGIRSLLFSDWLSPSGLVRALKIPLSLSEPKLTRPDKRSVKVLVPISRRWLDNVELRGPKVSSWMPLPALTNPPKPFLEAYRYHKAGNIAAALNHQ